MSSPPPPQNLNSEFEGLRYVRAFNIPIDCRPIKNNSKNLRLIFIKPDVAKFAGISKNKNQIVRLVYVLEDGRPIVAVCFSMLQKARCSSALILICKIVQLELKRKNCDASNSKIVDAYKYLHTIINNIKQKISFITTGFYEY